MSLSRRRFLLGGATMLGAPACVRLPARTAPAIVNDIHSRLNATEVARVEHPDSAGRLSALIRRARDDGHAVSIAGGRHAMGGQQFGQGTVLLDMRRMARVVSLDAERGLVTVEAGIQWPALVDHLVRVQNGRLRQWGIVQKQTGADRLTIGGALAANVHGRGLAFPPFVADVESFTLMDGRGLVRRCSRQQNAELFGLSDKIGTVEAGKDADLLLIVGDPLQDVGALADAGRVAVVLKRGEVVRDTEGRLSRGTA